MSTPQPAAPAIPASPAPLAAQPIFAANLTVLILSTLMLIRFFAKDVLFQLYADVQFIVVGVAIALAIGLFVTSLVLRARTKRAGGRQGIAIAAIIVSSVTLALILATIVVVALLFGFIIYLFTGGLF